MKKTLLSLTLIAFAGSFAKAADIDLLEKKIAKAIERSDVKFLKGYVALGKEHTIAVPAAKKEAYLQAAQDVLNKKVTASEKVSFTSLVGPDLVLAVIAGVSVGATAWKLKEEYESKKNEWKSKATFIAGLAAFLKSGVELYKNVKQFDKKKEEVKNAQKTLEIIESLPVRA